MIKYISLLLFFTLSINYLHAQEDYQNKTYRSFIKTVECYNSSKEQSLPVINLKSSETIT